MIDLNKIRMSLQDEKSPLSLKSKGMIRQLYKKLEHAQGELTSYRNFWLKEFTFIYGDIEKNASSHKKIQPDELVNEYALADDGEELELFRLFYAIQTFYSLFMKIVTYKLLSEIKGRKNTKDKPFILSILSGEYFEQAGIKNYCYPDWFCWIGESIDEELEQAVFQLMEELDEFHSMMSMSEYKGIHDNDQIKQIYENMIPHSLRHALGEFYTPDWLALYTIEQASVLDEGNHNGKITTWLDPTCGSGTFLFNVIQHLRKTNPNLGLHDIIASVRGFDVNPIAVLTAKTTYLIAIIDFIQADTIVDLPIYHYDVIHTPQIEENSDLSIDIYHDTFRIPPFVLEDDIYPDFKRTLMESSTAFLSPADFMNSLLVDEKQRLWPFYAKLQSSTNEIRPILAYMLWNRFEAYKLGRVDTIIGNPPWVNWEYLPKEYREKSQHLWTEYGLFSRKGRDLSFAKEDISILITYIVIDKFLKDSGHLAFVMKSGMLKSEKNGTGFRRFQVSENYYLRVKRADDLSRIRPFENAATSSAVIYLQKNQRTTYPVPCFVWNRKQARVKNKLGTYDDLAEVLSKVVIKEMIAFPADQLDPTSIWITLPSQTVRAIQSVLGTNRYKARTGVFTGGANAVYWLEIKEKTANGNILVSNIVERAKRKVERVTMEMEQDLVYPFVKGSNINQWEVESEHYLLCPHTRETKIVPIEEEVLKCKFPETLQYLQRFKNDLNDRKGFAGWERKIQKRHFHALLRIGDYTFSPYKVVWRYIASEFITAVISSKDDEIVGQKLLIPNEKVMYISLEDENEAYYVCGILSSDPIAFCVKSYMNPISISTHVLEKINIAPFQPKDQRHRKIAELCKFGHKVKDCSQKQAILAEINEIVADIYQLNHEQMAAIKEELSSSGVRHHRIEG